MHDLTSIFKGKNYLALLFPSTLFVYQNDVISVAKFKFSSAVTNGALFMIDVAAIILSAGSLLMAAGKLTESSAISGVIL